MEFNTTMLFLILILNNTVIEFVRTVISEVFIKPLAIRQGNRILRKIKGGSETVRKAWELLDYSLPENVDNILRFMSDSEEYIWDTVLPRLPEGSIETEEEGKALVEHLTANWSQDVFLNKMEALLR